jgi:hypothetical protein
MSWNDTTNEKLDINLSDSRHVSSQYIHIYNPYLVQRYARYLLLASLSSAVKWSTTSFAFFTASFTNSSIGREKIVFTPLRTTGTMF